MDGDPKPQPPREPRLEDCCGNGCTPCVFDLYAERMERYRLALAAWEARQACSNGGSGRPDQDAATAS